MSKKKNNCSYELLCLLDGKVKNAATYEYYTVLELKKENSPSAEEIRKAYHQVALKWHPDKIQQREGRELKGDEKSKWYQIETAYSVLSDPEKKQKYDLYDGKNKYEKMIIDIENMVGRENLKVEEKNWKPAYKIKKLISGFYVLINFVAERKIIPEMEKNIFQSFTVKEFLNRHLLLNLTTEKTNKKTNKIKLEKEDAK